MLQTVTSSQSRVTKLAPVNRSVVPNMGDNDKAVFIHPDSDLARALAVGIAELDAGLGTEIESTELSEFHDKVMQRVLARKGLSSGNA
ncbi:MAG: hypothetical protein QM537_01140 [Candidatus Symbiobacter sp.]|nr:hypothetical protein [Candidatus Symbiobacter sp.]